MFLFIKTIAKVATEKIQQIELELENNPPPDMTTTTTTIVPDTITK